VDGPFGIHKEEGVDDEDSTFFIKPDRAPSPGQSEVLFLVIELISRIKDFLEPKERRANYISEILGAFSAGSVSSDNPELVKSAITQIEQRFAQEHLANQIKSKIAKSLLVLAGFAAVSIALASTILFYPKAAAIGTFSFLAVGVTVGRFISTAMFSGERVTGFAHFDQVKKDVSSPVSSASLDLVIAFAAYILFSAGFIVISFAEGPSANAVLSNAPTTLSGSASAADQGLSTKMIDQDWRIAIGFGILIGTARSQFVDRIKNLANNAK
tara:strand:+ start:3083 stop:3892 length:810 start_codon:yes stop_codon:yes gene_type:complete